MNLKYTKDAFQTLFFFVIHNCPTDAIDPKGFEVSTALLPCL